MIKVFYVSPYGNDGFSGLLPEVSIEGDDGPFKTPARARDEVRKINKNSKEYDGINVELREGAYYLKDTLMLTPEDSGSRMCPVTYKAYQNERVVISGGAELSGEWRKEDGVWTLDMPWAKGMQLRSLFARGQDEDPAGGRREILARYPNYIEDDYDGYGYMYVWPKARRLLGGLVTGGDFAEFEVDIPADGEYRIFIGYAARHADIGDYLELRAGGMSYPFPRLELTADYRSSAYALIAKNAPLTAGKQRVMIVHKARHPDRPIHLDIIAFSLDAAFTPSHDMDVSTVNNAVTCVIECADPALLTDGRTSSRFASYPMGRGTPDPFTIHADPAEIKESWLLEKDAIIDIVAELHYFNEQVYIDAIDAKKGIIKIKGEEAKHQIMPSNYFFISGVKEELDAEREFYFDSDSGRMRYIPEAGANPNDMRFIVPRLDTIIHANGDDGSETSGGARVQWLRFEGLAFAHAAQTIGHLALRTPTDGAIKLTNAWDCVINGCSFTNVDGYCVWLHLDSCQNVVSNCEMSAMGAGGILATSSILGYGDIYDARTGVQNMAPLRNTFIRNHIHHGNRIRVNGAAILLDSRPESTACAPGSIIAYNDIHDMKRQGVFGFMNQCGNIIAHNSFVNLMTETADGGAINIAAINNVAAPNIVMHNLIDGVTGLMRINKGLRGYFAGVGIYPDWGASHFYSAFNIVANTGFASYLSNGGQENFVYNNYFINDATTAIYQSELALQSGRANVFRRNIIAFLSKMNLKPHFYKLFIPTRVADGSFVLEPSRYVNCDYNLYYSATDGAAFATLDFAQWQANGLDANSIIADPGLTDAENGGFGLSDESPARALGINPIPDRFGTDAPEDDALSFDMVSVNLVTTGKSGSDSLYPGVMTVVLKIPENGFYMLYVDRAASPDLEVEVRHAGGVSVFRISDMTDPNTHYNWRQYLGTYEFNREGGVVIFSGGGAQTLFPAECLLLERSKYIDMINQKEGIV